MKSIFYLFIIIVFALSGSINPQSRLNGRVPRERQMDRISERRKDMEDNEKIRRRDQKEQNPEIRKREIRQTKVLQRKMYIKEVEQKHVPEVNPIMTKQPSRIIQCVGRPSRPHYNIPADLELYNKLIKKFPKDAILHFMRGAAEMKYKDYYGAIKDFTVYLTAFPNDGEAHYQRGLAFLFSLDRENARLDFQYSYYLGYPESSEILRKFF